MVVYRFQAESTLIKPYVTYFSTDPPPLKEVILLMTHILYVIVKKLKTVEIVINTELKLVGTNWLRLNKLFFDVGVDKRCTLALNLSF